MLVKGHKEVKKKKNKRSSSFFYHSSYRHPVMSRDRKAARTFSEGLPNGILGYVGAEGKKKKGKLQHVISKC